MSLSEELKQELVEKGAAVVGYADLSDIPEENRRGFRYGISILVTVDPGIISGIGNGPTIEYYNEYNRLNILLDNLAQYASDFLEAKGFKAYPLTRKNVIEDENTWRSDLPHKTTATRAGIGWIGKCALLVTKQYGSTVRLTTVLTDACLETGEPINDSQCGSCTVCTEICPGNAVKGINWNTQTDRDTFYNAFVCRKTARERTAKIGIQNSLCGLCIYSCPYTREYLRNTAKA
ncbi:MAG: epoxyqueuosine reductase [Bacillota bacterium]|nr:epoxyqueuosine reductase [Bacillota bacterium]